MRIGCLHTATSNVAVLERAAALLDGVSLHHLVRADLLQAAGQAGGLTPWVEQETRLAVEVLAADCDAVLLTCSSLGAVVDGLGATAVPTLRVDRALADRAVLDGGRVIVLYAAPSSREPTGTLFRSAAQVTGAIIDLRLVAEAWPQFVAGDLAGYRQAIAAAATAALAEGADSVALAQVSMADAVGVSSPVFTSPDVGLLAAVQAVREQRQPGWCQYC